MTTISNSQYWNNIASLHFDDLFSYPIDFISQNEDDVAIKEEMFSSPETDQEQFQTPLITDVYQESHLPDLICGVCGAPAHGFNFDQITCESCKAFFRRNALRDTSRLKCRRIGSCVINIQTRRQCTYCRLKKCFDIQMRKDWIRTEEEKELRQLQKLAKEQKKLKLGINGQELLLNLPLVARKKKRLITQSLTQESVVKPIYTINCFGYNYSLSDDERTLLNNITNAYELGAAIADCSHISEYTSHVSFVQFLNDESNTHGSLVWFYKSIPHFKELDIEDQILLIKYNPRIGFYMSRWIDEDFHQQMSRTRRYFYRFMKYPLLIKLALIVLMFSMNLSTPRGSTQFNEYKNQRKIYETQNYYTTILWRYLNHLFGEKEATQAIEIIVMQILRYQTLMSTMDSRIRREPNHNILHSLMKSIFGLS